jgi:formylglycine-generating enzyme
MKKCLIILAIVIVSLTIFSSCKNTGNGQLIGVKNRGTWYMPDPYGMLFIPQGSYAMGPSDQDLPYTQNAVSRTVSVGAFYMDETEITNNEYRQFVNWVRDSIAHIKLGASFEDHLISTNKYGEDLNPPFINWKTQIKWDTKDEETREILNQMYLPENERFYRRKEFDTRIFNFEYYWIDLKMAANKSNRYEFKKDEKGNITGGSYGNGIKDRSAFIRRDVINVYPDTLTWVHDFTYSFNEPFTQRYFWHPAYDNYPVVGVNWKQARAFCIWRTQLFNNFRRVHNESEANDFRLPTESEWEWAARGGLDLSPYPWGGPYIRNSNGCFLGNYKPLRGNYIDDGGLKTIIVAHYAPNDFGLYDMAGNVAEWTSNAYDESAYNFTSDLNPDYIYEANDNDAFVLKRKVIRGGSWKDIGYFMQVSARTYEYQDTAKCYIGFRCIQDYLGRQKGDGPKSSNVY